MVRRNASTKHVAKKIGRRAFSPHRPVQAEHLTNEPRLLADRDPTERRRRHSARRRHPRQIARVFVAGLLPVNSAKSLRAQPGGKILITDGPYLETKEHIGGFWVVEAADLNEALEWGRKAVVACRAPVEVRPFGSQAQARLKRLKEKQ
jgi:hypothetical protein